MKKFYLGLLLGCFLFFAFDGMSQISITSGGPIYAQSFDALSSTTGTGITWTNNSTIPGWSLFNGSNTPISTYVVETGSTGTGSYGSYGAASGNTERALGSVGSGGVYWGSPASGAVAGYMAVAFANLTGSTINSIVVGFDGEQWRNGGNATGHIMSMQYGFGATFASVATWFETSPTFDFISPVATATPAAVDGNVAGKVSGLGGTLSALNWTSTSVLWLRWVETNDAGNDHGLAIDNFTFSANVVPTYTLTYNGNTNTGGAVPIDASSPYISGATVTVLGNSGNLVKTGFNFAGWNTAANGSGTSYASGATFSMPAANTILYAQWVASTTPTLTITGTPTNHGTACPTIALTPVTYTITNSGGVQADGITVVSNDPQFVVSALSSTTILAGAFATYQVIFTPATAGAKSATITVASTTAGSNSPTSSLTGTGTAPVTQAVTSAAATLITSTTATLNGNVTTLGVCPSTTNRGFVFATTATNANPLVGGTGVTQTGVGGIATGAFTLALTGLSTGTGYSFKAYVFDGTTYTYGALTTFSTVTPPANDQCANATNLVVGAAAIPGTLVNAAAQAGFTEKDVWYSFTPTCTGSHTITVANIVGATDIDFRVYSSNCPANSGVSALYSQTAGGVGVTEINTNNYTLGTTYFIRVFIFNNASPETSFTMQVIGAAPATPAAFTSSSASPCVGVSQTYTVPAVTNASSYTWSLPAGWAGTSTTNSITVTPTATAGNVSVTANNCYGNSTAQAIAVTPIAVPATPGTITGNTPVCAGSAQNYSISPVAGATGYTWTFPDLTWTGSSITESLNAVAGTTGGNITVAANNGCGSSSAQSFSVAVLASVSVPVATAGTVIGSNTFTANWNSIAGATGYYVDVYTLTASPTDLLISEYVEGSSNNKYIEIFNGTGAAVNLGDYRLRLYSNGSNTSSQDVALAGTLNNNTTIVYKNSAAVIYGGASTNNVAVGFNGDDAVALYKVSTSSNVDIFGRIGEDPGAAWTSGSFTTAGKTLVRKSSVYAGINSNPPGGFPTLGTEWNQFNLDVIPNLGSHSFSGGLNYVAGYQNVYTTDLFLNVTGLNPSTTYYYVVRADNGNCVSSNSNQISVTTASACAIGTQTITSFLPITGPVGTRVTITGTGFTGVTGIKFGSIDVLSYSVVNSTTIIAQMPGNAVTSKIKISFAASCSIESAASFALINNNGNCGGGAGVASDLFISEVYDALSGSLGYIELFNGTNGAINLSNYKVRFNTGAITTTNLSGSIAAGATFLLRIGTGTICGSVTANQNSPSTSGFNDNDDIDLLKDGVVIDHLVTINNVGFSMVRNAAATVPSVTYIPADWTNSTTENCSNLGTSAFVAGPSITITTQPADETDCSLISFTVNATSIAPPPNYLWKYLNPATNAWENASGITSASLGVTAGGTTTLTLTLTGNTAHLQDYQFYCELEEGSCKQATHAVMYSYPTRTAYRSKATGNWSLPANWQMTNTPAVPASWMDACQYPNAKNSDEINVLSGHTITLDVDNTVDKLTVDAGATLTNNSTNKLTVNNAVSNADFIVNGTYQDNSGTANTFSLATGATWQLGANATIIKTNLGGGADYRDFYEGGIAGIPSTATWIYRHNSVSGVNFVGSTGTSPMYYPNLILENTQPGNYASAVNTGSPQLSVFTMYGPANPIIIKGSLDVGGTGPGTVSMSNISSNANVRIDGNLTVKTGNTLTLAAADASNTGKGFEVKGNLLTDGTFICTVGTTPTGELVFSGTIAQSISGSGTMNLEDVNINNTGAGIVTVNKSFDIPGSLDFGNAAAKLTMGTGSITLKSTSTRTANVGNVPSTSTIAYAGAGKFIVERSLINARKWRLLSAPTSDVSQSVRSSWQENGATPAGYGAWMVDPRTTATTLGFDAVGFNSSVKRFNSTTEAWDAVANTTSALSAEKGYMVFVAGDRSITTFPGSNVTNLRTSGALYIGNQNITGLQTGKFSVIGNPYASRVDLRTLNLAANGFSDAFYVWDPSITGAYGLGAWNTFSKSGANYVNLLNSAIYGTALITPHNTIESGQAILVKSVAGNSLTFTEASKVAGNDVATPSFTSGAEQKIMVNLSLLQNNSPLLLDGAMASFDEQYSNQVDGNDIKKVETLNESVSWKTSDSVIVIDKRAMVKNQDTLFLQMRNIKVQPYQWEVLSDNMDFPGRSAFLVDRYKNTSTPLGMTGATKINFDVENVAASYAADRFIIVFTQPELAPVPVTFTTVSAIRKEDRSIQVQWQVENEINISRYDVERSADGVRFSSVNNQGALSNNGGRATYLHADLVPLSVDNYYRIKATSADGQVQYSSIVKVAPLKQEAGISVYPNPVVNRKMQVLFSGQPKGSYQLQLSNVSGQVIYKTVLNISNAVQMQNLSLPKGTAAGSYQLRIVDAKGAVQQVQVSVL